MTAILYINNMRITEWTGAEYIGMMWETTKAWCDEVGVNAKLVDLATGEPIDCYNGEDA